jgi:hypothetical protein|tara:strand:+ start:56 stop:271 length:216 start_codon:yes stop_codon:yes gene_type:complete
MKINELISDFTIFTTNEEKKFIEKINGSVMLDALTEREQFIVDNLVRKAIMCKRRYNGTEMVFLNDNTPNL